MEERFEASGRSLDSATLEEMEAEWQKIKMSNPQTQRRT
jgi:hypothetical protein